jgi:hypothetical protein
MSQERSPEAERILMRIRASAEPAPGVANRVLAGVEQRIALGGGLAGAGAGAGREISAVVPRVAGGGHVWQVAARLGRWGAFGLFAGAIGYQLGSMAHEQPTVPGGATAASVAAPASVVPSTPAVAASAAAHRPAAAAPPPAESALAVPVPPASNAGVVPSGAGRPVAAARSAAAPSRGGVSGAPRTGPKTGAGRESRAVAASVPLDLAEVLERLQRAQARLRDGDAHAALGELDALDTLEHGGVFVDERLVLRALAFCDIGRVGDARHVLAELERLGAGSIYRGRLEQGCSAALEP